MEGRRQLEEVGRGVGEASADGRRQVLDVGQPDDLRRARLDRSSQRSKRLTDESGGHPVLRHVLRAGHQASGEGFVLGLVLPAGHAPRHRLAGRRAAAPPHQQLRGGAREGGPVAAADEIGEAGRVGAAQRAHHGVRGEDPVAARHHLARENHLLGRAPAQPPAGFGDRLAPARRGEQRLDLEVTHGRRTERRRQLEQ